MKRAKRLRTTRIKPRNPFVTAALQRKAGAHLRRDKRAPRARIAALMRRLLTEET